VSGFLVECEMSKSLWSNWTSNVTTPTTLVLRLARQLRFPYWAIIGVALLGCLPGCVLRRSTLDSGVKTEGARDFGLGLAQLPSARFAREHSTLPLVPKGGTEPASYGLEYEGGSPKIWKFFGLTGKRFSNYVLQLPPDQQIVYIDWLFEALVNENQAITQVKIADGVKKLPKTALPSHYDRNIGNDQKVEFFQIFVRDSLDNPMSFMPWELRVRFINLWPLKQRFRELMDRARSEQSTANDLDQVNSLERGDFMPSPFKSYKSLVPLFGVDVSRISKVSSEMVGYEFNSHPVVSRQEFESQLDWFQQNFGSVDSQHKWFVFKCRQSCSTRESVNDFFIFNSYLETLLYLLALAKMDDIIDSMFLRFEPSIQNLVSLDLKTLGDSALGKQYPSRAPAMAILRSFANRFSDDMDEMHLASEIRYGLGNRVERDFIYGFLQKWALKGGHSRLSTRAGEVERIKSLFPAANSPDASNLARLRISRRDLNTLTDVLKNNFGYWTGRVENLPSLWNWRALPLEKAKLDRLEDASEHLHETLLASKSLSREGVKAALAEWVLDSNAFILLAEYLWDDAPLS
jgi:hypothetical protein